MDFPGGNITNVHVIDGFPSIHWRIYTEEPGITNHPSEAPTNGHTILKHLSRLKDLELRLRNLECLVSCYPRRLGLWIFSPNSNFDSLAPLNQSNDGLNRLQVGSLTLKVSASGNVSSRELVRTLSTEPQAPNLNTAGSQRSQNVPNPPRRIEGYGTSAAIYASFISAVTGAISLQLTRRHGAIPLGSRTLFTAVEKDGYETRIANDSSTAIPSLSTLHIQLTSGGKLTVALQTIAQHGMSRLQSPQDYPGELCDAQPGLDIWLSPSGTVARLVSFNAISQNSISSNASESNGTSGLAAAKRIQWKQSVLEWLKNFSLPVDSHEEELWIEVEVWEPFYSRLAGEIFRQSEEGPTAFPLKRILWPARYCFRRTKSISLNASYGKEDSCHLMDSPLALAEEWHVTGNIVHDEANSIAPSGTFQDQPMRDSEISASKAEFPEPMESLSRFAQYPDLQATSLIYPTPPDGATAISSDVFADQPDLSLPQSQLGDQQKTKQATFKEQADPDIPIGFGPSAGLTVGSGLYDTNGDDDLFGEMSDRDFGTRGITDADFSFFDDPDFEDIAGAPATDHIQSSPNLAETNLEEDNEQLSPGVPLPNNHAATETNMPQTDVAEKEAEIPSTKQETLEAHMSSPREENSQPISPPLSPIEVKKILFSGPDDRDQSIINRERKQSHFTPVSFKQDMGDWDQKYGAEGRFWFSAPGTSTSMEPVNPPSEIPTIGLPRRGGKVAVKFDNPAKVTDEQDISSGGAKGSLHSTSDSSSVSSDDNDSDEVISEREPSPVNLARKRKRAQSNTSGSVSQALEHPLVENPQLVSANKAENSTFLGNFLSTFSDWSLLGYFSVSQNQYSPTISQKEEQIQVAQLLVDQITQSSLDHVFDGQVGLSGLDNEMYPLRNIFEDTMFTDEVDRLDLKGYASLQHGSPSPPTSDGLTPHQVHQRKDAAKGTISKLLPPHLRIRRGKGYLEALPPAVSFWETFDLEPAHGPKDISAYCIHPRATAGAADAFLERLELLYSACNLGNHVRGDMCFERGLGSWNMELSESSNYLSTLQSLRDLCEELGNALSGSQSRTENFVVYVINPFKHAAALADICAAFWQLFQKYIMGTDKQQAGKLNELVLQIVPISFVMSPESIVVPSQSDYLSLALEVYSRCPSKYSESNLVHCAPPVLLTESAPKAINFRLVPERLSPLQDGKSLHIACSRSLDQRWITVAWSDNTGALQRMMSYCLRYRNSVAARGISDVRNEIWGTTQTIMDRIQARWKIIIVNTEPVDQDELDTWTNLAEQHNKSKSIPLELMILHVNATTDFSLEPPSLLIPTSVFNAQASSTPVATPGPSAASPDQYGNAPTPTSGGNAPMSAATPDVQPESESDFFLTDIRDESWGVILSHRLNSSPHLTEYRPALASGYLLRRKGPTDGDGVFATNVNLIYAQRPTSSYEALLKEVLRMYHDLAVLARARGTRCVQRNTLPWHIATAVRAQELLSYVF